VMLLLLPPLPPTGVAGQVSLPPQKAYVGRDDTGNLVLNSTRGSDVIINGEDVLRTLADLRDSVALQQDAIAALRLTSQRQKARNWSCSVL